MMPITDIYLPLSVSFPRDPKVRTMMYEHGADGVLAAYLYIMMCLYCRENLTDGWVPVAEVPALAYPLDKPTAERLASVLLSARLLAATDKSRGSSMRVLAYVKRNGTRQDAERRVDQARHAGRKRWAKHDASGSLRVALSETTATPQPARAEAETESIESSSVGVDDPRAPARLPAREDDDSNGIENRDDDDLDGRIVIMLAAHGYSVNREQARGVRLRIIGGRKVDNPARYVSAALAAREGARKWAPAAAAMPPRGLDPVTASRAAMLRQAGGYETVGGSGPQAAASGQGTLEEAEIADRAHRGAAEAKKLLADRPRPPGAAAAAAPSRLSGPQLAAAQVAEARAERAPLTVDDGLEDDDFTDGEQDQDYDGAWNDDDGTGPGPGDDPQMLGGRVVDDVSLPEDPPPF